MSDTVEDILLNDEDTNHSPPTAEQQLTNSVTSQHLSGGEDDVKDDSEGLIQEKTDEAEESCQNEPQDFNVKEEFRIDPFNEIKKIPEDSFFVKLTGLPTEVSFSELGDFIGVELSEKTCKFTRSGEAFVILECEEVCRQVLSKHDCELRGNCIEAYPTSKKTLETAFDKFGPTQFVHLKTGKPELCTRDKILNFIREAELLGDDESSLVICKDISGKLTGEAYIQLKTSEMAQPLLGITGSDFSAKRGTSTQMNAARNLNRIRLISLVKKKTPRESKDVSKPKESRRKTERRERKRSLRKSRSPVRRSHKRRSREETPRVADDRKLQTDHYVRVFGLSNNVVEQDLLRFFAPLDVVYVRIEKRVDLNKLPSALVFFRNHYSALSAMKNDKGYVGSHCVRISLFSTGSPPHAVRWSAPPAARPCGQTPPFRGYSPQQSPYYQHRRPVVSERPPYSYQSSIYRPEMPVRPSPSPYCYNQRPESYSSCDVPRPVVSSSYKQYSTAPEPETSTYNPYMKNSYSTSSRPYTSAKGKYESGLYGKKYDGPPVYGQSEDYYPTYSSPKRADMDSGEGYNSYSRRMDNTGRGYSGGQYSHQSRYTY